MLSTLYSIPKPSLAQVEDYVENNVWTSKEDWNMKKKKEKKKEKERNMNHVVT